MSDLSPAVSVVTPVSRGGLHLRQAVESVQAQTFTDWEHVIVSDGCQDDLSDIELIGDRVRLIRQCHRGASVARNVGVSNSRGHLIAFLDEDDRMLPDRLLIQSQVMENADIGMCHTQFRVIDAQGQVIGPGVAKALQYHHMLRSQGGILLSATMVRRSLIDEVGGFNSVLPLGEDLDFFYRIARESTLYFIGDVLTEYRRHNNNTWGNTYSSGGEVRIILTQHRFAAEASSNIGEQQAIEAGLAKERVNESAVVVLRARRAFGEHKYVQVAKDLIGAFRLSPSFFFREVVANRFPLRLVVAKVSAHRSAQE